MMHRPRGQSFGLQTGEAWGQLPQVVQLELRIKPSQTALEGPEYGSPPAGPHPTWPVQWVCWEKRQINPQTRLWNGCDVTPQKPSSCNLPAALPSAGQTWDYRGSLGLFPRLTPGGSTPLSVVEKVTTCSPHPSLSDCQKPAIILA